MHSHNCVHAHTPHTDDTHTEHRTEAGHTPQVLLNPIIFQSGALLTLIMLEREGYPSLGASFWGAGVSVNLTPCKYSLKLLFPPLSNRL